jgi:serine protease
MLGTTLLLGTILLQDGARMRVVERTGAVENGLAEVRFTDAETGRGAPALVGRRAIVKIADERTLADLDVRPVRALMPSLHLWLVESKNEAEDGLELAARLQRHPSFGRGLEQALPDLYVAVQHKDLMLPPNDPRYPGQWFFPFLGMEDAWRIESGRPEVGIVVIDTGCDLAHADLRDKLDPGYNAIDGTNDGSFTPNVNGNYHGTACAGLVAASTGNGVGVAGTCPGCRLRCVHLLSDTGNMPISASVSAFQFVMDSGAAVASNSWGFVDPMPVPQALADAIQAVHTQGRSGLGALVVFAAGNNNRALGAGELEATPGVTTVGAVDNFGEVAQFSNYGPSLAVVAPTGTLTTDITGPDGNDPGDYTASFSGTSSACPIVAGIFGLMVSAAPTRTASDLEQVLRMTAKQSTFATPNSMGHDDFYGYGLVQPAAALRLLKPPAPPPPMHHGCSCELTHDHSHSPVAPLVALLLGLAVVVGVRSVLAWKRALG